MGWGRWGGFGGGVGPWYHLFPLIDFPITFQHLQINIFICMYLGRFQMDRVTFINDTCFRIRGCHLSRSMTQVNITAEVGVFHLDQPSTFRILKGKPSPSGVSAEALKEE